MGLRLLFLPNFPGATFIPDSRVRKISVNMYGKKYSNVPNKRGSIKARRQTLPEINVHARLFGTLEYVKDILSRRQRKTVFF